MTLHDAPTQDDETAATNGNGGGLSVLKSLKTRREEIVESEFLDLAVPRWSDPEVYVRYKPVPHDVIRRAQRSFERAPKKQQSAAEVDANADVLIRGCDGVYAVIDGRKYSLRPNDPHGDFTLFDEDLAANLGLENASARQVVRELFITEGDIVSHAKALVEWSGYRETEADEEISGE